ncbi:MAG: phosphatidate cytidylyltransferase [Gammaproteobacteria bacterium]
MLKQRLITAAVLIPICVLGILGLPTGVLSIFLAIVIAMGAWEWAKMIGLRSYLECGLYTFAVVISMLFLSWLTAYGYFFNVILLLAIVGWLVSLYLVQGYSGESSKFEERKGGGYSSRFYPDALIGVFILAPAWLAMVVIHSSGQHGPYYVLFLLVLIWGADGGAYFAGRKWGRRKLAPNVSPGKTWEGVLGALAITVLVAIVGGLMLGVSPSGLIAFVLLCLVTVLFSIVGDLMESMFKRRAGIKDSGSLLPGHGGVLDRIDSLTAATPFYAMGLLLQGIVQ